jgi:hypothetical protein
MTRCSRRLLVVGAVVNAAIVGVWLLSRTIGLPVGPKVWDAEAITAVDGLTTSLEVGVVAVTGWLLARGCAPSAGSRQVSWASK